MLEPWGSQRSLAHPERALRVERVCPRRKREVGGCEDCHVPEASEIKLVSTFSDGSDPSTTGSCKMPQKRNFNTLLVIWALE